MSLTRFLTTALQQVYGLEAIMEAMSLSFTKDLLELETDLNGVRGLIRINTFTIT